MKNLPYLLLLALFTACSHSSTKEKGNPKVTTVQKDTIMPGDKDSVLIDGNNHKMTKGELRKILQENPELNDTEFPRPPDISYFGKTRKNSNDFGSEVGQDEYYVLYTYFLKLKNGEKKYQKQRENLIKIYRDINLIDGMLTGSNISHLYYRVPAYAEYSIYRGKDSDYYTRKYDISKQKILYINTLKQIINDELANDPDHTERKKAALKRELSATVKELNNLITDYFYLTMAREFQYSHY